MDEETDILSSLMDVDSLLMESEQLLNEQNEKEDDIFNEKNLEQLLERKDKPLASEKNENDSPSKALPSRNRQWNFFGQSLMVFDDHDHAPIDSNEVPKPKQSKAMENAVERFEYADWLRLANEKAKPRTRSLSPGSEQEVINQLTTLGFDENHVQKAAKLIRRQSYAGPESLNLPELEFQENGDFVIVDHKKSKNNNGNQELSISQSEPHKQQSNLIPPSEKDNLRTSITLNNESKNHFDTGNEEKFEIDHQGSNLFHSTPCKTGSGFFEATLDKILDDSLCEDADAAASSVSLFPVLQVSERNGKWSPSSNTGLELAPGWREDSVMQRASVMPHEKPRKAADLGLLAATSSLFAEENSKQENDDLSGSSPESTNMGSHNGSNGLGNEHAPDFDEDRARHQAYLNFMERIRKPEAAELYSALKKMLISVLNGGPQNCDPQAIQDFLEHMEKALLAHPLWADETPETAFRWAREGLEQYFMGKVYNICFGNIKELQNSDETVGKRLNALQFLTPCELGCSIENEVALALASTELRRMPKVRTPGDMVRCVVRACVVVMSTLNLSRGTSRPGADEFLPAFIYVVLKANVPRLPSIIHYIESYRYQSDLMTKSGYCLANLQSALAYLQHCDHESVGMDENEFNACLEGKCHRRRISDDLPSSLAKLGNSSRSLNCSSTMNSNDEVITNGDGCKPVTIITKRSSSSGSSLFDEPDEIVR
eukprot:TRINITY_DN13812_c0_g2_i1.p1 TRINITY_DN13812_c0_g2~~TRINITY_DN13812_c0_g2_i1.p1  ORF type:complete len:716 (-),score=188.54 TRINITY_DN13812_c0_g2_i1:640-2787(-)